MLNTSPDLAKTHINFFVFIPLYREDRVAKSCVEKFYSEFKSLENVRVCFITHYSDDLISIIVKDTLKALETSGNFIHLVNREESFLKSSQLNFGLKYFENQIKDADFISVYDCDSIPDSRVFKFISKYLVFANISQEQMIAFQQSPYYPLKNHQFSLETIAKYRNIHSLNYHYTAELTSYFRSESFNPIRMSVHLTGHGQHIRFSALKEAGGFIPPSCDSSLGFALSYKSIPIVSIPIPDVSQSTDKISDMYMQGLRWYNGCDLYIREVKKNKPELKIYVSALFTFFNNLRWFLLSPICLIAIVKILLAKEKFSYNFIYILVILLLIRHCLLAFAYKQLDKFAKETSHTVLPKISLWMTQYFLGYLLVRLIWSLPPWHYYILQFMGKKVEITSTHKSSDLF
jgi:hypothetical protein